MGFGACGGIVGPTAAGWVFDQMGSYFLIWLALGALVGVAVLLVLKIKPNVRISSSHFANGDA